MRTRWSSTFTRWTVRPIGAAACASLVATGCALRPFTPSVNVAFFAEEVPAGRAITLPSSKQVLDQWQLDPASPWAPYGKLTLISALDALPEADRPDRGSHRLLRLAVELAAGKPQEVVQRATAWLAASAAKIQSRHGMWRWLPS